MRIMYTYGENEPNMIEEVQMVELCLAMDEGNTTDIPDIAQVIADDGFIGEYRMDGTEETYQKAVKKFNDTLTKLLMNGWCYADDFGCNLEYKREC